MKKSLLFGFIALLLLLGFDTAMNVRTAARLRVSQRRIAEVAGIRIELRELLAAYVNAETGQRGFLLTGEEPYLEPFLAAHAAIARSDLRMKTLLTPELELAGLRDRIEALGSQKMTALEAAIAERREHGPEAALAMLRQGHGKDLMDQIRLLAAKLDGELEATMAGLLAAAERQLAFTATLNLLATVVVAGALIALFFLARLHFSERETLAVAEREARARVESLLASERSAHSEATHANKLKDEFLAVVSHELRTPLNAIVGWTSPLREGATDAQELQEGLDTIDRNAHAQARLIDDLLDVSRIISGKVRLRISEVDLRALVTGVVEGLRPAAEARGVKIALGASGEAAEVLGDPDRLQQVVWNLVSNAIKFTPRGGEVALSVARTGSAVALEVRDTGQGVRADFLPRIFDRFSQQDASIARAQSGLGLGLSITRHLVELHGGTITVRSAGEGQGATFHVEIPMIAVRELKEQLTARGHDHPPQPVQPDGIAPSVRLDGLRELKAAHPELPVIVLTANDSLANAIKSIKQGAFHFFSKVYAVEELQSLCTRALDHQTLARETAKLREEKAVLQKRLQAAEEQLGPVAISRRMREVEQLIARVAPSEANVQLTGESGVGKEVFATAVHRQSARAAGPMVKLNCGAFPVNMIESELFGYVKGAFTGAVAAFPGMLSEAHGGTLFLDEITELPAELQTRFLRVLQDREFRPLGSTKNLPANFRLIAACNRSPAQAIQEGRLRQDIYFRLKTFEIEVPPLRERREDLPKLIDTFLRRFAQQLGKPVPQLAPEALELLRGYSWPGNVRELQNAVEHALVLCDGAILGPHFLPSEIQRPDRAPAPAAVGGGPHTLGGIEREALIDALRRSGGNKKRDAELLGIHHPTLYAKLKRFGIAL